MYGPGIATRFIIEFTAAGSGTWALGNSGCFTPVHLCPPNRILIRGAAYSITCPTSSYEHLRPVGLGMSAWLAPISAVAGGQLCRHVREYPAEHAQRACLSHRRELLAPGSLRISTGKSAVGSTSPGMVVADCCTLVPHAGDRACRGLGSRLRRL